MWFYLPWYVLDEVWCPFGEGSWVSGTWPWETLEEMVARHQSMLLIVTLTEQLA